MHTGRKLQGETDHAFSSAERGGLVNAMLAQQDVAQLRLLKLALAAVQGQRKRKPSKKKKKTEKSKKRRSKYVCHTLQSQRLPRSPVTAAAAERAATVAVTATATAARQLDNYKNDEAFAHNKIAKDFCVTRSHVIHVQIHRQNLQLTTAKSLISSQKQHARGA